MEATGTPVAPLTSAGKGGRRHLGQKAEGGGGHPERGERGQKKAGQRQAAIRGMKASVAGAAQASRSSAPAARAARQQQKAGQGQHQHGSRAAGGDDAAVIVEKQRTVKVGEPALDGRCVGAADGRAGRRIDDGGAGWSPSK